MNELFEVLSTPEGDAAADAIVADLLERDLERQHADIAAGKASFAPFLGANGAANQN